LPENLHLTLAFIGEVSPKKLDKIVAILNTVELSTFDITIEQLGAFSPKGNRAQSGATWWAGVQKDKTLMLLQREITYKLAICGFPMDGRKYKPHITIGREVVTAHAPWMFAPFGETVTSFELMKSERIDGKLTYTELHRVEAEAGGK
jgi:2'-5' RNA ligase